MMPGRSGAHAEERALQHLRSLGHVPLARNYRVRGGEIDLITLDGECVVFTEVKQRATNAHGDPLEFVTTAKIMRLRRTALHYLMRTFGTDDRACRFDVIAVLGPERHGTLTHVQDVF